MRRGALGGAPSTFRPCPPVGRALVLLVDRVLQVLGRLEGRSLAGCDLYRFAGAGIASDTCRASPDLEVAETGDRDLLTLGEGSREGIHDRVHRGHPHR